jgi:hypothetical protein
VRNLGFDVVGDGEDHPAIGLSDSSPVWQRHALSIGGVKYAHGITVQADSSVTIELNRACHAYRAMAGIDDLTLETGAAILSVYGDGAELWRSPLMRGGEPAVPVNVSLEGVDTLRLTARPGDAGLGAVALADWADSEIHCG